MIDFQLDGASVDSTVDHLEQTRLNILMGIRQGMSDGMVGLAERVADNLHGYPIQSRSGDLIAAVLKSPRILEGDNYIAGEVSTTSGKQRNLGLWLEFGIHDPAVGGKLYEFTSADGESAFTHGHKAFQIAPKPFFNNAFEEYYPTILETINQRIAEACDE